MSNKQCLAVVCQGDYGVGRTTYLLWTLIAVLLSWVGSYSEDKYQDLLIIFAVMIPTMIFGTGSISFFQTIFSKGELLKRLSIAPCFDNTQRFSSAFLYYVFEQQAKVYLFITVVIALFRYTLDYFTWTLFINSLSIAMMVSLFNLAIMLWSWSIRKRIDTLAIWLMIIYFIASVVLLFIVVESNTLLWLNTKFIGFISVLIGLCCVNFLLSHKTIPRYI